MTASKLLTVNFMTFLTISQLNILQFYIIFWTSFLTALYFGSDDHIFKTYTVCKNLFWLGHYSLFELILRRMNETSRGVLDCQKFCRHLGLLPVTYLI